MNMSIFFSPFYEIVINLCSHLCTTVKSDQSKCSYRYILKITIVTA